MRFMIRYYHSYSVIISILVLRPESCHRYVIVILIARSQGISPGRFIYPNLASHGYCGLVILL